MLEKGCPAKWWLVPLHHTSTLIPAASDKDLFAGLHMGVL